MVAHEDLMVFVEACRKFAQGISIRGSTAYVLSTNTNSNSIVDSVPPLADLDLIVRDKQPTEAMRRVGDVLEYYRTYVPASRFIHIDVFYENLPVRRDSPLGNVVVRGLPEVRIDSDGQKSSEWTATRSPRDQQIQAEVESRVRATLFRDFLYLLRLSRRHRQVDEATGEVARLLRNERPNTIGLITRQEGGMRELARIDKALVKHVLLQYPEQETKPITEYLSRRWLRQFVSHLNKLSKEIIRSDNHRGQTPYIGYAVDGRVQRFTEVPRLCLEEKEELGQKLAPDFQSIKQRLTPSLKVALPNPEDPDCCGYRDFSKGIAELFLGEPCNSSLLDVVLMEGREKYYAVHAQASEGFGARSLRTDPGFMGMLNHGSLSAVRLMGVRTE